MQHLEEQKEEKAPANPTWQHFMLHDVLGEIPLIGSVCRHEEKHDILYDVGRSVFVLTIGTAIMMADILDTQSGNNMAIKGLKIATTMGLGMATGSIAYNVASLFAKNIQNQCKESRALKQHLLPVNRK